MVQMAGIRLYLWMQRLEDFCDSFLKVVSLIFDSLIGVDSIGGLREQTAEKNFRFFVFV